MSQEGQLLDKKSLRAVSGRTAGWDELVKDCVAFANASGGKLLIGIEDHDDEPPARQVVQPTLPDTLARKITERTVNVMVLPQIKRAANGGEYLELQVPRANAVASTSNGRYFLRVADQSKPVTGDDVMRLANERSASPWETQTTLQVPDNQAHPAKTENLISALRSSDRVKVSVKEKSPSEILAHYMLTKDGFLSNLGILCVGKQAHRGQLASSPVIQFIKYDQHGQKVNKLAWDDHSLSPMELVEAAWRDVADFRERYELPDGLYRQHVPAFDEIVVRELLVNALVHRPYTQRGDIFLNLHPEQLDVVNPGPLPLGVTPGNILHTTIRRNEHLARLFHDLKLMEREGSGFDKIYEVLLSQGRPAPTLQEEYDSVQVSIRRRILKPEVIDFLAKADQQYQLTQRERIALGLLAQHEAMTARELASALELPSVGELTSWLKRPLDWEIVHTRGRTQSTRYYIAPQLLKGLDFVGDTTLKRIEPHRLLALIEEDVGHYASTKIGQIHERIGPEIPRSRLKRAVKQLVEEQRLVTEGKGSGTRYSLP